MNTIIMADGSGTRWNNYLGMPKHFAMIDGEPIIVRTVRLLNELAAGPVIVTSHDPRYEIEGSRRYEPKNNRCEVDKFTYELIEDGICFLFGDTYYTRDSLQEILTAEVDDLLFFGNTKSIVAVRVEDGRVMRRNVDRVRELYLEGKIPDCRGWRVYQSFIGQDMTRKPVPGKKFVVLSSTVNDVNTPDEYNQMEEDTRIRHEHRDAQKNTEEG